MVEPLRKRRPGGTLYRRRTAGERELEELEKLELTEVVARARVPAQRGKDAVSSEALVHVLRREVRSATTHSPGLGPIDGLLSILLQRCEAGLRWHLGGFDAIDREEICKQVLDGVVDQIYDDGDVADYAEVNFNDWLWHRRVDACRKQKRKIELTERLGESVAELSEDEAEIVSSDIEGQESPERTAEALYALNEAREKANLPPRIEAAELSPDDRYRISAMVKKANLPPNVLDAFLLHHYWGMQIESKDTGKHTLVKHFGKSEKTIRLWLSRADEAFAKLRGTTNGGEPNETSELGIGAPRLSR